MSQLNVFFKLATAAALVGWLLILLLPAWAHTERAVRWGVGTLLSLLYVYLLFMARHLDTEKPRGGFFSLRGVISLFKNPRVVLAGWVHFLAFDLLVALWIRSDAAALPISHWMLIPVYLLTLMFGPAGLLAYGLLRAVMVGV
jgi:Domain of unknown function (DUF4281)